MDPQQAEKLVRQSQQYARTILDSLSAHIAIIDENGMILETNCAWRNFASNNEISMRPDTLNINYLEICDGATGDSADRSNEVADGIRRVIRGELEEFVVDYPCHSPDKQRWFYMRATRAVGDGPLRVVISHENITALKIAEEQLRRREDELQEKTRHLEEANVALRAVIRQNDDAVRETEQIVLQNIRESVLPTLQALGERCTNPSQSELVARLESALGEISSPFLHRLSHLETVLTAQEMKVALLIKEGRSSKEIADQLNLSGPTVNFHRRNLRKKLGLANTNTNLRSHLLSFSK